MVLAAGLSLPVMAQSGTESKQPNGTERSTTPERMQNREVRRTEEAAPTSRRQVPTESRGRPSGQDEREAARSRAAREREERARQLASELPFARLEDAPKVIEPVKAEWRQPMPAIDRTMMDTLAGYAPPAFSEGLIWLGHNHTQANADGRPTWLQFRDRIVVVQSWTSANSAGRQAMADAIDAVSEFSVNDVALLLVHTPEGHDGAAEHIEHASKANVSIVVDPVGEWCDRAGVYRTPVNFIVDRNGEVRYGGLSPSGIVAAIGSLIDEEFDEHLEVSPLPPMQRRLNVAFPNVRGSTGSTPDIQGQIGPDVFVPEWFNDPPSSLRGKAIKIEFWRTGCPHCINAIPKLNETIERFGDDLVIVGITHESPETIRQGLTRRNIDPDGLKYQIGIDPHRRTASAVGVRGVPHSILMSSDGIVRWQGHPASLTDTALEQIIQANNAMNALLQLDERRWVKN